MCMSHTIHALSPRPRPLPAPPSRTRPAAHSTDCKTCAQTLPGHVGRPELPEIASGIYLPGRSPMRAPAGRHRAASSARFTPRVHEPATMSIGQFEEARLFTTNAERERWETQATLFSVIVSLDFLERAYVRGAVPESEYVPPRHCPPRPPPSLSLPLPPPLCPDLPRGTRSALALAPSYTPACNKMLTQCKTLLNLITSEQQSADRRPGAPPPITSVEDFMKHYRVRTALCECGAAVLQLTQSDLDGPPWCAASPHRRRAGYRRACFRGEQQLG